MLSIFGDFGDQEMHDYPQKNEKMPLKGLAAVFQAKKKSFFFFSEFFLQVTKVFKEFKPCENIYQPNSVKTPPPQEKWKFYNTAVWALVVTKAILTFQKGLKENKFDKLVKKKMFLYHGKRLNSGVVKC